MKKFITEDGYELTEGMIATWTEAYDSDRWPDGERNAGPVIQGRPPLSAEGSVNMSIKVTPSLKEAIAKRAKIKGISSSEYVREAVINELLLEQA